MNMQDHSLNTRKHLGVRMPDLSSYTDEEIKQFEWLVQSVIAKGYINYKEEKLMLIQLEHGYNDTTSVAVENSCYHLSEILEMLKSCQLFSEYKVVPAKRAVETSCLDGVPWGTYTVYRYPEINDDLYTNRSSLGLVLSQPNIDAFKELDNKIRFRKNLHKVWRLAQDRDGVFWIDREYKIDLNRASEPYKILNGVWQTKDNTGFSSYEMLKRYLKDHCNLEIQDNNKRISNALDKTHGFLHEGRVNGVRIISAVPRAKSLLQVIRGQGIKLL